MGNRKENTGAGADALAPAAFPPRPDAPVYRVTLWPNRSLSQRGFRLVMGLVALGLAIPVLPLLGTPVGLALLPFVSLPLLGLWWSLRRNTADGRLVEHLAIWPDAIRVERHEPDGTIRAWDANPYWVRLALRDDGPVENYLTLRASGREIELGAFLSPEERTDLHRQLADALNSARITPVAPG
jgi:uncharacterized membrane protein